jgi:hypothetical protein
VKRKRGCGDATMLRDNLAGLIGPIVGSAGTITLPLSPSSSFIMIRSIGR